MDLEMCGKRNAEVKDASDCRKEAVAWIDEYVEKQGPKLILVAEGLRRLMKKTVAGV